jgi:hypothetical protein
MSDLEHHRVQPRRLSDPRIEQLAGEIADVKGDVKRIHELAGELSALKLEVQRGNEVIEEVRDVLASFRVISKVAKWLTVVVAAVTAIWHGYDVIAGGGK